MKKHSGQQWIGSGMTATARREGAKKKNPP
jgi:hypothetical protein